MNFEIDVSGGDLLSKDYTICVANKDSLIRGFKFNWQLVDTLSSRYKQGLYRYAQSKKGKSNFKVRLYCIVIFYLIKAMNLKGDMSLTICRDFTGREDDIKKNLKFFLETYLKLNLDDQIYFSKLSTDSNAHKYAYLIRHDTKNQMKNYVNIDLKDIEIWLKK